MEESLRKQIVRAWFKEWTIEGVYEGIADFYRLYLGREFDEVGLPSLCSLKSV